MLEGLSYIDFKKSNVNAFSQNNINRSCSSGTENAFVIALKPTAEDEAFGIKSDSRVEMKNGSCIISGGIIDYYDHHILGDCETLFESLSELGADPFKLNNHDSLKSFNNYKKQLTREIQFDLYRQHSALSFMRARIPKMDDDRKGTLKIMLDAIDEKWGHLTELLPAFFIRKAGKHLKTTYKYDDIEKELANPQQFSTSLLADFVNVIEVPKEDFLDASRQGSTSQQISKRDRIRRQIDRNINKPFSSFYSTEAISLGIEFNAGCISFTVQSEDGDTMVLSERSNGLRWYLELFIDAQSHDAINQNTVFLLDEPGISLHINAQRELLRLFRDLADKGNQIVYSTHSPYMLDLNMEGLHRIRAVTKDSKGFTYIHKTAYDSKIDPNHQEDTLAPVMSALGMSLNVTFGPAMHKLNIVTEGISDYIYLTTMAKILNINNKKIEILPSVGASNCINICTILQGWGCRYLALFDYDKAGVEGGGEKMRTDFLLEFNKHYCYLADVCQDDVDGKAYKQQQVKIEDVIGRQEIERYCESTGTSLEIGKPLMAKLICTDVECGKFQFSESSIQKFRDLFDRIEAYAADE